MFNALADSRKNVVCEECAGMSANQKSTESDKDRDSDDYENDYDNFAPPPQPSNVQNNIQQQGRSLIIQKCLACIIAIFIVIILFHSSWNQNLKFLNFRYKFMVSSCH